MLTGTLLVAVLVFVGAAAGACIQGMFWQMDRAVLRQNSETLFAIAQAKDSNDER
jgi:hypothetical protein